MQNNYYVNTYNYIIAFQSKYAISAFLIITPSVLFQVVTNAVTEGRKALVAFSVRVHKAYIMIAYIS